MKHKMSKTVLCLCMVAVLAIGLAIPTFAASNGGYSYFRLSNINLRLGAGTSGQAVAKNTNVHLMNDSVGDYNQMWKFVSTANGTVLVNRRGEGQGLALNINHANNNCNIYSWQDNSPSDCVVMQMDPAGIPIASKIGLAIDSQHPTLYSSPDVAGGNTSWSYDKYDYYREIAG